MHYSFPDCSAPLSARILNLVQFKAENFCNENRWLNASIGSFKDLSRALLAMSRQRRK